MEQRGEFFRGFFEGKKKRKKKKAREENKGREGVNEKTRGTAIIPGTCRRAGRFILSPRLALYRSLR